MKQLKKLLCGVLMVCMVIAGIGFMPQTVQAATVSGNDGEIHWEIKGDTLTLSAVKGTKGRMKDYSAEMKPQWAKSNQIGQIKNVEILNGITKLGTFAFFQLDCKLDKFTIKANINTIPAEFVCCMELDKLVLFDNIKTVKSEAFDLVSIKELYISKKTNVSNHNFTQAADVGLTDLQKVYTYSGSSAESMVNDFVQYAKETEQYGEVRSGDDWWNGSMFYIRGKKNNWVDFIDIIYLDKPTLFSKVKAPSSFSVSKGKHKALKLSLPAGFTQVSKYTGSPADVKVTFKSSNPKVATVSSSGKVAGKKNGTTKITVTMQTKAGAKKTLTTKVTVK